MARDSQQTAGHEQKLDSTRTRRTRPDGPDSVSGPGVGAGQGTTLLSRSGFTSPRGKLDSELPKIRLHGETLALLQLEATKQGIPLSEFVRLVLECVAYGTDAVANSEADRIRRVGALVGGSAPQGER
jgi:hypothetical protein